MRAWWLVFVFGCGRFGFSDPSDGGGPPDDVPDPVDWTDFTNQSTTQTISGTNRPIELELQASLGAGTPTIEYRLDGGAFVAFSPAEPATVTAGVGATLVFRVRGNVGDAAFLTISNISTGNSLLDTVRGTVTTLVTGAGTPASPFVAPGAPPASCNAFLASYPEMLAQNGNYAIDPGTPMTAFCDMTSEGGGWTLVARVVGTSTTHTTPDPIGVLVDPEQPTTAKLADATMTTLGFTDARFVIALVGTVFVHATSLDLGGTPFSLANAAAPAYAGPYIYPFITMTTCSSDCGIAVSSSNMGFGKDCGYRYFASAGNPKNGMGCAGSVGHPGTVWVR